MSNGFQKCTRVASTEEFHEYNGTRESAQEIISEVERHKGVCFSAAELQFRHDMGTYWHPVHGFIYVPQGARRPGQAIEPLRDNELIVRADTGIYAVVFPGDYVVRRRSGFYPLASESFDRDYLPSTRRRGSTFPVLSPAS